MSLHSNDATVSHQWATRGPDERHTSLYSLGARLDWQNKNSASKVVSSRSLVFEPDPAAPMKGILVKGGAGVPYAPTNWAFNQACQRVGAPAGFLKQLPAPMACDNLNYATRFMRDVEDVGVLVRRPTDGHAGELAAMTGPNYGRVPNSTIANKLIDLFGDGVSGDWKVPGEFGVNVPVTKANTTLYCSDRDMFVFLADEKNRVTLPNRRDGKSGSLARGFYVTNSEVGASTLVLAMYLFDYACMNRILWGVQEFVKIGIRHTAGAPDRYLEQMLPAIEALRSSKPGPIEATLKAAQAAKVETDLDAFLKARKFTGAEITGMKAAFEADEGRPLETPTLAPSLWDITTAATAYARQIEHVNVRSNLEARAGALLDLVAV